MLLLVGCSREDEEALKLKRENQIRALEESITTLREEVKVFEKGALNDAVDSQGAMRENYAEFAKELLSSEKREKEVRRLEKEIEQLQVEKERLEKQR